jgi:hypothetical protein
MQTFLLVWFQMKGIIVISLILLAGLANAYTPEQQVTMEGVRLSFQLGQAYEKAAQGQDVPAFNDLVDQWNTWVVKNFGNDTTLLMAKLNELPIATSPSTSGGTAYLTKPFNTSSVLSEFGKQQVYVAPSTIITQEQREEDISQKALSNF